MKKLKDMTIEELQELYKNNRQFSNVVYECAYEWSMDAQYDFFKDMGAYDAFAIDSTSYATYITTPIRYGVKDGLSVAGKLVKDYLTDEELKLYEEICELKDKYDDEEDIDKGDKIADRADDASDELADLLTKNLRDYEDINDDDIYEVLSAITDGALGMSDWEEENGVVYETIVKEYK